MTDRLLVNLKAIVLWGNLKEECGVTSNSLHNVDMFLSTIGPPSRLDFRGDQRRGDYFVKATWTGMFTFTFSGFAWGYGGEGPHGLDLFLQKLGVTDLSAYVVGEMMLADKFHKTACSYFITEQVSGCPEEGLPDFAMFAKTMPYRHVEYRFTFKDGRLANPDHNDNADPFPNEPDRTRLEWYDWFTFKGIKATLDQ